MFIKKDLRKIPTILQEAIDCETYDAAVSEDNENETSLANRDPKKKRTKREEPLRILKLGRRKQEFEGSVKILCQPSYIPKLQHLEVLNLYDCDIHDLNGFGPMFEKAAPKLETLNLAKNKLSGERAGRQQRLPPSIYLSGQQHSHRWLLFCTLAVQGSCPRTWARPSACLRSRAWRFRITRIWAVSGSSSERRVGSRSEGRCTHSLAACACVQVRSAGSCSANRV